MPAEFYYAPKETASPITLAQTEQQFAEAGIPFTKEPQDAQDMAQNIFWLTFEPLSTTTVCASVESDRLVFATVYASYDDKVDFADTLHRLLESMGFSSGEDI